jgi:hypothetical protein
MEKPPPPSSARGLMVLCESPYKPETTLLCVKARSKNVIAHRFPIETTNKPEVVT